MDAQLEARLRGLLDRQDIHDVLMRYCRGVDRGDTNLIASCYHPDAVDDHGAWVATGTEAPALIVSRMNSTPLPAMHFLGNIHIELDGDTALVESYLQAVRLFDRDGKRWIRVRAGRYLDRFTRRAGEWRIAERVLVDDWNRVDELAGTADDAQHFRPGHRDRNDPVYALPAGRVARQPGATEHAPRRQP